MPDATPPESDVRPETLDALVDVLADASTPIVVLAGPRGVGRGALCEAAADRLREEGSPVAVWHLDLDGFEPDITDPLVAYRRHLAGDAEPSEEPSVLEGVDLGGDASELGAALLSLVLRFDESLRGFGGVLSRSDDDSTRDAPAILRRALDTLTTDERLVVHLRDAVAAPVALRRFLAGEAERRAGRLLLVLTTPSEETTADVARGVDPAPPRLEVAPIDDESLAAEYRAELDARLESVEPELREILGGFLLSAAVCGPYVPIALPLGHMGLDEDARESVIDWVDDVLVDELGWLDDLEFRHPSFPGLNLYTFADPRLRREILRRASEYDRVGQAISLLRFLEERGTPIPTRGMARMFLAIGELLDPRDRAPYAARLAWWTGQDDDEALAAEIRRDLEAGRVDEEMLWTIARGSAAWSVYRRVVVLRAYTEAINEHGELAIERRFELHVLWSDLLMLIGEYEAALAATDNAIELIEATGATWAQLLARQAEIQSRIGRRDEAKASLDQALPVLRRDMGDEHPLVAMARATFGRVLAATGDAGAAREHLDAALETLRATLGDAHPEVERVQDALDQL